MALQGPIPILLRRFFPDGVYIAGPIEKLRDFDRSKGDRIVQQLDKNSGLPLWTVDVIDARPQARQRTVKVKVPAEVAPVLSAPPAGSPFVPVEFTGLVRTVTPGLVVGDLVPG